MIDTLKLSEQHSLMGSKRKSQGWITRAYEWFLNLPVAVILATMWLTGVALLSGSALALYLLWLSLEMVAGG
jgi:hypothetical protein